VVFLIEQQQSDERRKTPGLSPMAAVGDWLLLALIGGSKEELRPTASLPLTRPLIRGRGSVGHRRLGGSRARGHVISAFAGISPVLSSSFRFLL
jgi:hypothetical protein